MFKRIIKEDNKKDKIQRREIALLRLFWKDVWVRWEDSYLNLTGKINMAIAWQRL